MRSEVRDTSCKAPLNPVAGSCEQMGGPRDKRQPAEEVGFWREGREDLCYLPDTVMVAGERVEGPQLHPALTQLQSGVSVEAADIGPHQRDSEQRKGEHSRDGVRQVGPPGAVVAQPVTRVRAAVRERGARNDDAPLAGANGVHRFLGSHALEVAVQGVDVVVNSGVLRGGSGRGFDGESHGWTRRAGCQRTLK